MPDDRPDVTEIRIPFDPNSLSLNARLHWQRRRYLSDVAKQAATAGYVEAGYPRFSGKVTLSLLVRRGRVMDVDNAIAGMKSCVDQLIRLGLAKDDSAACVQWGQITFETGKRWRDAPEVVVSVTPSP